MDPRRDPWWWPPSLELCFQVVAWLLAAAAALAVLVLLGVGCSVTTLRPEDPPPVPLVIPPGACEAAAARVEELQCVVEGVELWHGFAEACRLDAEVGIDWHPLCIAKAPSCDAADAAWLDGCAP